MCGLSHRTAPVEVRERLTATPDALGTLDGVSETMLLSTCNRVEIYGIADDPREAARLAFARLAEARGVDPASVAPCVYVKVGAEAVRHCFRVAASLDSMILGEPQILGQVKEALALARRRGTVGLGLDRVLARAFAVAKKVRTETEVGRHAVSAPSVAVELATKIFGDLAGRPVLLIGAGRMGELAARHALDAGVSPLYVANRTRSRALDLARALGGTPVDFDAIDATLARVDIVIASAAAEAPIVRAEGVARALGQRRGRPLFLIDVAVPRAVEPAVHGMENVFCYDVDDLGQVVDANVRERFAEARKAEALVDREAARFLDRRGDPEVLPTIVSLRQKVEAIRRSEVARALGRCRDASPETRAALEALSSALVNKILHPPTAKLHAASRDGGAGWASAVAELFGLDRSGRLEARRESAGAARI